MRILITIPHFYKYNPNGMYGSGSEARESRVKVLREMLCALRNTFNMPHAYCRQELDQDDADTTPHIVYEPADSESIYDIDICLCTTEQDHLVEELDLPEGYFRWMVFSVSNPLFLGYTCHQVLKENRGKYDYYCYMEDDLIIQDMDFFRKLKWFEQTFGSECLLQPSRYMTHCRPFYKEYIDPEMKRYIKYWIDYDDERKNVLETNYLGESLHFIRTRNPHAGCFFLSAEQYEKMCQRDDYGKTEYRFCGPLECSASLDIIRTFAIYRVDYQRGNFFEIEHIGKKPPRIPDTRFNRAAFSALGYTIT